MEKRYTYLVLIVLFSLIFVSAPGCEEPKEASFEDLLMTDCGTAGPVTFSEEGVDADEDTKKAWECFTTNLETCTPAKIKATVMERTIEYKILKKEGEICEVYGPMLDFEAGEIKTVTCKIPMKYIEYAYSESEKLYAEKKFFKAYSTVGIITAGGGKIEYAEEITDNIVCE